MVPVQAAPGPQLNLLPKNQSNPMAVGGAGKKGGNSLGNFMSGIMGGGANAADDVGLLDHNQGGAPAR